MRRLVLFVEGDGDVDAVPALVKRLITDAGEWYDILLDDNPLRVGEVSKLVREDFRDWKRLPAVSLKRPEVGGVLLILDGDIEKVGGTVFCAATIARSLAGAATHLGAGKTFSVAVVFARQEYETWLIAGLTSLAGKRLPDGRLIKSNAKRRRGISKQVQGTRRNGSAQSLKEATNRPAIRSPLPSSSTLRLFGPDSYGRFDVSSRPCRASWRQSAATLQSFRRADRLKERLR